MLRVKHFFEIILISSFKGLEYSLEVRDILIQLLQKKIFYKFLRKDYLYSFFFQKIYLFSF